MDTVPLYRLLESGTGSTAVFHILTKEQSARPPVEASSDQTAPPPISSSSSSSSSSLPATTPVRITPQSLANKLFETVVRMEPAEPPNNQTLHFLLLATLESVATQKVETRSTMQIGSTLHLIASLTTLFTDTVALWLQLNNQSNETNHTSSSLPYSVNGEDGVDITESPPCESSYQGLVYVARTVLRLWSALSSQVLRSNLTTQQAEEVKSYLSSPILTISEACYNLRRVGLFCGNECLDHEFTLMMLETVLACLHSANLLALVVTCHGEDVIQVFRDCLSDGCHEWFTYLCSKLHAVAEADGACLQTSGWGRVMDNSYALLAAILRELIQTAEHIKLFQRASKSALSGEVAFRQISYTVELSRDFDKLTIRMSKLANVVLDCFKQVSVLQLLSLQLLSETASDTVEIISNFLGNILDPAIQGNAEVLDHYLELLENVWFRLSPDYSGSATLWKKLSNYFTLLCDANRGTVHQVLYHIQCLFSHESTMLKSQLTQHVVLPLHTHLITRVREKLYGNQTSGESTGHRVEWNENALEEDEKTAIVLFLKLLNKVVSHPSSVQLFLSDTRFLYSLFLLLPVSSFCPATLTVAEQCLKTLQKYPLLTGREGDISGTQKTLLKIFLKLGFSMPVDRIMDLCLAIADGKISLPTFGIGEVDRVHKRLQDTFENPPLSSLLSPAFINHFGIIANVWEILARLAPHGPLVLTILRDNYVWDVVSDFSPILGSLLTRIQQQIDGGTLEAGNANVCLLQELAVSLLSNLMCMAHFLCWQRREPKVII